MLIGDDCFVEKRNFMNHVSIMMCSMMNSNSKIANYKLEMGELDEQWIYVCKKFPLIGFDSAEIQVASSVDEMIRLSNDSYDWIVTDLDYGEYYREGGMTIIRAIKDIKAIKAIFTSARKKQDISCLDNLKNLDYIVAPCLSEGSFKLKSELLGETIAKHYL